MTWWRLICLCLHMIASNKEPRERGEERNEWLAPPQESCFSLLKQYTMPLRCVILQGHFGPGDGWGKVTVIIKLQHRYRPIDHFITNLSDGWVTLHDCDWHHFRNTMGCYHYCIIQARHARLEAYEEAQFKSPTVPSLWLGIMSWILGKLVSSVPEWIQPRIITDCISHDGW